MAGDSLTPVACTIAASDCTATGSPNSFSPWAGRTSMSRLSPTICDLSSYTAHLLPEGLQFPAMIFEFRLLHKYLYDNQMNDARSKWT